MSCCHLDSTGTCMVCNDDSVRVARQAERARLDPWKARALAAERERDDLRRRIAALVAATKNTDTDGGTKP